MRHEIGGGLRSKGADRAGNDYAVERGDERKAPARGTKLSYPVRFRHQPLRHDLWLAPLLRVAGCAVVRRPEAIGIGLRADNARTRTSTSEQKAFVAARRCQENV